MYYLQLIFIILPKLSLQLSRSFFHGASLYSKLFLFLVAKRIHKDDVPWKFDFVFDRKEFTLQFFEGSTDVAALREIFIDNEYELPDLFEPKVIIDLGAHTGNTALYFSVKYPNAIIYALEASPKSFEKLQINTRVVENIVPVFGAVSDVDGAVTFYESENSLGNSVYKKASGSNEITIPCFTLQTFFTQHKLLMVDFMKVDIEGSEDRLFKNCQPDQFARTYIIEVHNDLMEISQEDFTSKFFNFNLELTPLSNPDRFLLKAEIK